METFTVDQAAAELGISTKTIRRWIDSGKLSATETKGPRGKQWSINTNDLQTVKDAPVPEPKPKKSTTQPEAVTDELKALSDVIRELTQKVDRVESELRDTRHQLHQFQEATIKALPAPKRSWLSWLKR